MRKNWIGLCDLCGEKSLVNYGIAEWDKHPEPNLLVICQDKDSCVVPPNQEMGGTVGFCCFECEQAMMDEEIRVAEAAQEEAAASVWK